jgi:predicted XRE-type DNA-binding protein
MAAGQTVTQKSVGGITGNLANDRAFSRVGDARRIKGSGNGFADPGFDPAEAEVMKLRAEVMIRIGQLVKSMVWTQAEAARWLGVTQPRISRLVKGKWGGLQPRYVADFGRSRGSETKLASGGLTNEARYAPTGRNDIATASATLIPSTAAERIPPA